MQFYGRPLIGKILVLPKDSAAKFSYNKPWSCISISHTDRFPDIKKENRIGLLQLQFADIDYYIEDVSFTNEQAKAALKFAGKVWDKSNIMMIHCHAGLSRSPAIAMALSEVYQKELADLFEQIYFPNTLVLEKLREHTRLL